MAPIDDLLMSITGHYTCLHASLRIPQNPLGLPNCKTPSSAFKEAINFRRPMNKHYVKDKIQQAKCQNKAVHKFCIRFRKLQGAVSLWV